MGKQKIDIEYPLATKSPAIIWEQISSAHGLERWFADHVNEEEEGILKFTWGEPWTEQDIRQAHVIESVKFDHIRLKWDYEDDDDPVGEYARPSAQSKRALATFHVNISDIRNFLCTFAR